MNLIASIGQRRAVLAAAYRNLEHISSEQWRVATAGPTWWKTPGFEYEETETFVTANAAVMAAKHALPWLLRLGVRTGPKSARQA